MLQCAILRGAVQCGNVLCCVESVGLCVVVWCVLFFSFLFWCVMLCVESGSGSDDLATRCMVSVSPSIRLSVRLSVIS